MADPIKTPVKKAITGSSAKDAATALTNFNAAMVTGVTAALLAQGPASPASASNPTVGQWPTGISFDPVTQSFDGVNWNYTSAINYVAYV